MGLTSRLDFTSTLKVVNCSSPHVHELPITSIFGGLGGGVLLGPIPALFFLRVMAGRC